MENNLPKIYSKKAILGFSIFLSVLFGGVLLYQNLIEIKKQKEAYIVLALSVFMTVITIIIVNLQENPRSSIAYLSGMAGGSILSYYFVPKYFPDEDQYPKKSLWKPLLVGLIITVFFVILIIYSNSIQNV
ncbi:uncharacterized membrane protein YidH (DUF202 family) [Chryseobacterium sp. H1D6B]|uniref:hypothetical protein n=1 Tax=Chryseobacterium sp. H1D6B TaxID=2940588 RepID=UPI0015CD0FB3|nr:hypothetical protein [Chryseobacterium sp. H1D6B]MDH6253917.1 uncharacterized membrane protein YidH (DUF202 family) [Chryseobacterium sp. H1D6B]